jgi:hypothetical protein
MLFIAALPLPYGYYMLLRLVTTIVFVWAAIACYQKQHTTLPWLFGLIAILFNPLIPVHLPKELWLIIDISMGILLLSTKNHIVKSYSELETGKNS